MTTTEEEVLILEVVVAMIATNFPKHQRLQLMSLHDVIQLLSCAHYFKLLNGKFGLDSFDCTKEKDQAIAVDVGFWG